MPGRRARNQPLGPQQQNQDDHREGEGVPVLQKVLGQHVVERNIDQRQQEAGHGQTDEGEIGVTYNQMDTLLKLLVDEGVLSMNRLEESGFSSPDISRVVSLLNRNSFKRRLPDIAPLGRNDIPDNVQLED